MPLYTIRIPIIPPISISNKLHPLVSKVMNIRMIPRKPQRLAAADEAEDASTIIFYTVYCTAALGERGCGAVLLPFRILTCTVP